MNQTGGVTIPLFHCVFNGYESITSYMKSYDENLYKQLEHLYIICISENNELKKKIVAGFIVKTSYTHNDSEFLDAITGIAQSTKELNQYIGRNISFLPARLGLLDNEPLSESEMLKLMTQQSLKFSSGGNA